MSSQRVLQMNPHRIAGVVCLSLVFCGCGNSTDLDRSTAKAVLEKTPVTPAGEVVAAISDAQLNCAVKAGLFRPGPYPNSLVATEKGISLGYGEPAKQGASPTTDPRTTDPDLLGHWFLHFSKKLTIVVDSITGISDGRQAGLKVVDAKILVNVQDECFSKPLRLWYVTGGAAEASTPFDFRRFDDGWRLEDYK